MSTVALMLLFSAVESQYGIPPKLLASVCWVESKHQSTAYVHTDGHTKRPSKGMCQLQQAAWSEVCREYAWDGAEPFSPEVNAVCAARYLKKQHKRYGNWMKAVVAYNKGSYTGPSEYGRKVAATKEKL